MHTEPVNISDHDFEKFVYLESSPKPFHVLSLIIIIIINSVISIIIIFNEKYKRGIGKSKEMGRKKERKRENDETIVLCK